VEVQVLSAAPTAGFSARTGQLAQSPFDRMWLAGFRVARRQSDVVPESQIGSALITPAVLRKRRSLGIFLLVACCTGRANTVYVLFEETPYRGFDILSLYDVC
jgi:hypothetical protein